LATSFQLVLLVGCGLYGAKTNVQVLFNVVQLTLLRKTVSTLSNSKRPTKYFLT